VRGTQPLRHTGKGNPYLPNGHMAEHRYLLPRPESPCLRVRACRPDSRPKGVPGEAAATAARADTFPGERYRRLVKRRGKLKALAAILVIIWHPLAGHAAWN
jgi:hypothetical protein